MEPVEKMYEMIRASSVKEDVICGITFLTTFFHMRLAFQFSGFLVLFLPFLSVLTVSSTSALSTVVTNTSSGTRASSKAYGVSSAILSDHTYTGGVADH